MLHASVSMYVYVLLCVCVWGVLWMGHPLPCLPLMFVEEMEDALWLRDIWND